MELQLEGVVREILPLQEGEGRNGRWRKQSYVLETQGGQYPKLVCMMAWGDRIDQFNLKVGENVTASIDIESREFNGRWYTDVKVWKVEKKTAEAEPGFTPAPAASPGFPADLPGGNEPAGNDPFSAPAEEDDLPF